MPRETEYVKASELSDGSLSHMPAADVLPHRGKIVRILNDSTVLTIECENGTFMKSQHAPVERYVRLDHTCKGMDNPVEYEAVPDQET